MGEGAGRDAERMQSRHHGHPPTWEGGASEERCSLPFTRGTICKMGMGDGAQEEPSPDPWKHVCQGLAGTTCASGTAFQKRLVRPVPSEPGRWGTSGVARLSLSPSPVPPLGGGLDLGLTEKQLLPLGEGTSVLVWEQRRACVHPWGCCPAQIATQRPLVPVQDRASGAPMPSARPEGQKQAWLDQTHCRARNSPHPDWLIFYSRVLSYSLIGLSFPSWASDWPSLGALSSYHH